MADALDARASEPRFGASRPITMFLLFFGLWIGFFSILFHFSWVDDWIVVPMTEMTALASNVFIRLLGFDSRVTGTIIAGADGFAVNILKGCNAAYVIAIYLSAVFSFPSTLRERAIGAGAGVPIVLAINIGRIVSLYYIGVKHPDLFESFHYHVWEPVVIVLAMAVWIAWAEIIVKIPRR